MNAGITYRQPTIHFPATWIAVLVCVLAVVCIAAAMIVWGHPVVTAPTVLPQVMPGIMS
jgi:hypothetical protein